MNSTQIKTVLTPLIGLAVAWLASRFPLLDAATWNTLVSSVVFAVVAGVMAYFTGGQSLKDTVGGLPQTTVVTDAASAAALPDNKDVVAATPEIVAAIKKAQ